MDEDEKQFVVSFINGKYVVLRIWEGVWFPYLTLETQAESDATRITDFLNSSAEKTSVNA